MNRYKIYFFGLVLILSVAELVAIAHTIHSLCWDCQIIPEVDPIQPLVGFALFLVSIFCAFNIYEEFRIKSLDRT